MTITQETAPQAPQVPHRERMEDQTTGRMKTPINRIQGASESKKVTKRASVVQPNHPCSHVVVAPEAQAIEHQTTTRLAALDPLSALARRPPRRRSASGPAADRAWAS